MSGKLRGYLITRFTNMSNSYTCKRLEYEANKLDVDLKTIGVSDIYIYNNKIFHKDKELDKVDFLINRHKNGNIKDLLNKLGYKSYNNIEKFDIYLDKFWQMENINSKKFLKPKYILSTADIDYEILKKNISTPFVAKGLRGSEGNQVYLISSKEELKRLKNQYNQDKEFLFQELISSSLGKDLRIYSIKGKAIAAMIRKSESDFRANFALGAIVEKYELNDDICKIARDIYADTGLDFCGIDLLFGKDKLYFCEVNAMAGIRGIEESNKINIARNIIESIKEDFNE